MKQDLQELINSIQQENINDVGSWLESRCHSKTLVCLAYVDLSFIQNI